MCQLTAFLKNIENEVIGNKKGSVYITITYFILSKEWRNVKRIIFEELIVINMHEHFFNYCGNCFL